MRKEIISWETCRKKHITNVEPDINKIKSILIMVSVRLGFLQKQKPTEREASLLVEDYYEIIKELLIALLLKNGLKSDNHECLIAFFKENYPDYEYETNVIHELKNIRNRIDYDGIFVEKAYLDRNKLEFEHIIKLLQKLIEKG